MNNNLFRQKSLDKISSPEQLDDYIRVVNPNIWIVLSGIIVLLVGILIWSVFGRLDSRISAVGSCEDGKLTCYVSAADINKVNEELHIIVDGETYAIAYVSSKPVKAKDQMDEYLRYSGKIGEDDWVYEITDDTDLPTGDYKTEIVVESVKPISFVLN